MEHYIQQLIDDFRAAATTVPPPGPLWEGVDLDNPCEVEDMAYIEECSEGIPQPLSEIVGIEAMYLPPMVKLTEDQAEKLYAEMEKTLKAYHFKLIFPEGLPAIIKYRCLCDVWDEEYVQVGAGEVEIEFCDEDPAFCPFPDGFCECQKAEEEFEREEQEARERGDNAGDWDIDVNDLLPRF